MEEVIAGFTVFCVSLGLIQLTLLLGFGRAESRRLKKLRDQGVPVASWEPDAIIALVPCLNEALVIGATVQGLLENDERIQVIVIDDASTDATAELASAAHADRVAVVRRQLPNAQLGKGRALNAGYAEINRRVERHGWDPARVLVIVMDADGRLSSGALDVVAPLFADDEVGGVQLGVRIRNRGDNVLARIQDCEFWGIAALGQLGRMRTGTVSLGGNGQFTRLAALRSIGEDPWTDALTEDLALAVTLNIGGWRLTSTPEAWVSQQGLTTLRPLVRQRTRWFQGHMTTAIGRMGDVWRAPALPNGAVLEMSSYLLIPFFIVLPWSVLSQLALYSALVDGGPQLEYGGWGLAGIASFTLWYLLSFSPTLLCGIIYARRQPDIGVVRAIVLAHLLMAWNYILFAACWSAVVRMVRGRTGWVKTARIDEGTAKDPTDAAVPAA